MAWPAMAYGVVAAWQSAPVDRGAFFSDYARMRYPASIAREVAEALSLLDQAENHLQKVLGQSTQLEVWRDPFEPAALQRSAERREDLRLTRLDAETADEHLQRALAFQPNFGELQSHLVGARLLNFAALKFLYALEMTERWKELGPKLSGEQLWYDWESEVVYADHGRLPDLMDAITELRTDYRTAWLAEYTPYRLGTALGRWDAEYEYWRRMQEKFRGFFARHQEGEPLPPMDTFSKAASRLRICIHIGHL